MSKVRLALFLTLLALATWPGSRSLAASDDEDVLFFGGQVETPSRRPQPLEEAPAPVTVITRDDIRRAGAQTLPEVLALAPGVDVVHRSEGEVLVSIRGFNRYAGNKVLVMLDSRPLFNLADSAVDWNLMPVPVDAIERVEIVRGPGSVMYGENAFFGTINIITRDGNRDGAQVGAGYGSGDSFQTGGGVQYRQFALHSEYLRLDRFGDLGSSAPNQYLEARRIKPLGARVDIERAFSRFEGGEAWPYALTGGVALAEVDYHDFSTHDRMAFLAFDNAFCDQGVDWEFGVRVLGQDRQVDALGFPAGPYQRFARTDVDFKGVHNLSVADTLVFGGNFSHRYTEDEVYLPEDMQTIRQLAVSGYVENQLALADRRVLLTTGVRADGYERMRGAVSPRAGLVVILSPEHSVKLGWGKAYSSPSVHELYQVDTLSPPWVFSGNSGLRPESVTSWNLDYYYQDGRRRSFSLTFYHHELDDLIVYRLEELSLTERPYRLENEDRATSYGAEVEGRSRLTDRSEVWGNYSYNEAYYLSGPELRAPFSPRHMANAGLDYRADRWRVSVWGHYVGSQQAVNFDSPYRNRIELKDYGTVSARVELSLPGDLSVSVMASDIGGTGHYETPTFAPVSPYYFLSLRWEPEFGP